MSVTSVTKVEFPGQTDRQTAGGPLALTCPRPLHPSRKLSFRDKQTVSVTQVEFPGQTDRRTAWGGAPALTCPRPLHTLQKLSFRDRRTAGGADHPL